jgi:PTH1 family peptidyl-tRNA hydrolase
VHLLASRHDLAGLRGERGLAAVTGEIRIGEIRVALAVPTTYMNDSGAAVRPLLRRFGIEDPGRLVVVHDELDLEPGRLRVKVGGGTAGNRGLQSIQAHIHTADFVRVRIGIGKPPGRQAGADHVLRRPGKREREVIDIAVAQAADAVEAIAAEGVDVAMNRFNRAG